MKKILLGCSLFAALVAVGWLFGRLSGIWYGTGVPSGLQQGIGVIMSTVYVFAFLGLFTWFGYKKYTTCFVVGGVLFAFVSVIGALGFLGYGFLLGILSPMYFALVAPFEALIDAIAYSFRIYYAADRVLLVVPSFFCFLTMAAYVVGTILRAHERALYYSLRHIDSRYEYRLPPEDAAQTQHTA